MFGKDAAVLLLQLFQATDLGHTKTRKLLLPEVKSAHADAHLKPDLTPRYHRMPDVAQRQSVVP